MTAVSGDVGSRVASAVASYGQGELNGHAPALHGVSVVIPAKNEARNIQWVLERLPNVDEVILVDGLSTDDTVSVARSLKPDIVVVSETRPGKGAALRAGFEAATGDYVVMLDADGSMDPGEITEYVARLQNGYDLVKGSRYAAGGGSTDISRLRNLGNRGLLLLANTLYGSRFTELCYGFMAFRRSCLPDLALRSDGFEIETEMVVRAVRANLRVGEVPSFELPRRHGESNLNTFRDGQRVLKTMVKERFRRQRRPLVQRPATETPAGEPLPVGPRRFGMSTVTLGVTAIAPMAALVGLRALGLG